MAQNNRCNRVKELLESLKQDTEVEVEEYGEPKPVPKFSEWPRQLDMWPLELMLVEAGWKPKPIALKPRSVNAVARILREANRRKICVVPRGGGSNVVGSSYPAKCCVILDLTGLNKILEFSPEDNYVYVEAGARVSEVEEWLNRRGYTLYYYPQSSMLATIGGSISMLGTGAYAPGVGNIEDIVLWIDVVLANGSKLALGSKQSPRGWQGPGTKQVFMGAEGSLGVIVAAGLKIRPMPSYYRELAFTIPGFGKAINAAKKLVLWGIPRLLRVLDSSEARILYGLDSPVLLLRLEADDEELLDAEERYVEKIIGGMGGIRRDEVFRDWWSKRYSYDEYTSMLWSMNAWLDTIDTAATWTKLSKLNNRLLEELSRIKGVITVFSHAGHFYVGGGSLYHTVVMERDIEVYWHVWRKAAEIVLEEQAAITHQHGYGILRLYWAPKDLGDNYKLYCKLKTILDPNNVLAPYGLPSKCSIPEEGNG